VVVVSVRRMSAAGCWWWDERRAAFERGACLVPIGNEAEVEDGRWAIRLNAPLAPGRYQVSVYWRDFGGFECAGAFAPMCVEFDVR
jgi:hypothetical protein